MMEPSGPLPRSVYWRRRATAVAALVAVLALLVLTVDGLVGGNDSGPVRNAAGSGEDTVLRSTPPPMTRPSAAGTTTSTTSTTSPAAESDVPSSGAPSSGAPASATSGEQPGRPKPCAASVIEVRAETGTPSYRVGERPLLKLVVINVGERPCVRDVSRGLRELVITSKADGKRLWSSNDCYSPPGKDRRTLRPGKRLVFTLNWAGRTSEPGCPVDRETVPAGRYLVTGKLGKLSGDPVPLVLKP